MIAYHLCGKKIDRQRTLPVTGRAITGAAAAAGISRKVHFPGPLNYEGHYDVVLNLAILM